MTTIVTLFVLECLKYINAGIAHPIEYWYSFNLKG